MEDAYELFKQVRRANEGWLDFVEEAVLLLVEQRLRAEREACDAVVEQARAHLVEGKE